MTRDEAIKIRMDHTAEFCRMELPRKVNLQCAAADVDFLVAIGFLKLDEPRTVDERAQNALRERFERGNLSPGSIMKSLHDAGLKIVEA